MKKIQLLSVLILMIFNLFGQATIPFEDDFESGSLNFNYWSPFPNMIGVDGLIEIEEGIGIINSKGLKIGKKNDNTGFATNTLDLFLNLSNESNVEMTFWIKDWFDETDQDDGIYFSDDAGKSFKKVVDFKPDEWCDNLFGQHPPLDIDKLADNAGLNLTNQFIIRFQQRGEDDFVGASNIAGDGFILDDVKVYDPQLVYETLPFEDDFNTGVFKNAWAWNFADQTATTGSNFDITSPMSRIDIASGSGIENSNAVALGRRCDGAFTTNALDLHLDLSNQTNVEMTFWIKDWFDETDQDDGIYFSDDAGKSFKKVVDFKPDEWCDNLFGQHPPLDIDKLADNAGLNLTNQFIIRFQQRGEDDFVGASNIAGDGFILDDVKVYDPQLVYETLPFEDDFNTGVFKNAWAWNFADQTSITNSNFDITSPMSKIAIESGIGINNTNGVAIGRRCDGAFTTNALDLHLDLLEESNVKMTFWLSDWFDETDIDDGIFFSNDAGQNFTKVFDFDFSNTANNTYLEYLIDISDLADSNSIELTENFIIRFQQRGEDDFVGASNVAGDGLYFDNISINQMTTSTSLVSDKNLIKVYPIPSVNQINIDFAKLNKTVKNIDIYNHLGEKVLSKGIQNKSFVHVYDISILSTGIYFLLVELDDGNRITKKIIKQ